MSITARRGTISFSLLKSASIVTNAIRIPAVTPILVTTFEPNCVYSVALIVSV
ncbi:MAG: hypothetical protein QXL89_09965 [Nitrososphaeria archaeon]